MTKTVCIVGGGIGGLTAALKLNELGYSVHVYEKESTLGGKMNSYQDKYGNQLEITNKIYSKEQQLFDIMAKTNCLHNLVDIDIKNLVGDTMHKLTDINQHPLLGIWGIVSLMWSLECGVLGIAIFIIELIRWKVRASYREYLKTISIRDSVLMRYGNAGVKKFVSIKEHIVGSTDESCASSVYQLLFDFMGTGIKTPAVMKNRSFGKIISGTSQKMLIKPWKEYLKKRGVTFYTDTKVERKKGIVMANGITLHYHAYLFCVSLPQARSLFPETRLPEYHISAGALQIYLSDGTSYDHLLRTNHLVILSPWKLILSIYAKDTKENKYLPTKYCMNVSVGNVNVEGSLFQKPYVLCSDKEKLDEIRYQIKNIISLSESCIFDYYIHTENLDLYTPTTMDAKYMNNGYTEKSNTFLVGEFTNTYTQIPMMTKATEIGYLGADLVHRYIESTSGSFHSIFSEESESCSSDDLTDDSD